MKSVCYAGDFNAEVVNLLASFRFFPSLFLVTSCYRLFMRYRNMYMLLLKIEGIFQALETALSVFQHFSRIPGPCTNPEYI